MFKKVPKLLAKYSGFPRDYRTGK